MTDHPVHASAVQIGSRGVLIRGASGSGKSSLLLQLISAEPGRNTLVADDRVMLEVRDARLFASPPAALAGVLEVRGQGLLRLPHVARTAIDLVADLVAAAEAPRMPTPAERLALLMGISIPRIFIACGAIDGAARVAAALSWPVLENA
jgi:serine kinase of HPr protein (carbohydrate metabolism regulator)